MFAINRDRRANQIQFSWQTKFATMLPEIEGILRLAFNNLDSVSKNEAVTHALLAVVRLHKRGLAKVATPSTLAWHSSRKVKRGRPAVGTIKVMEPPSRY